MFLCPNCETELAGDNGHVRATGHVYHDYIQFWQCPECDATWNRWDDTHEFFDLAEKLRLEYETGVVQS